MKKLKKLINKVKSKKDYYINQYGYNQYYNYNIRYKKQQVTDIINLNKLCIAFFRQKALNNIFKCVKDKVKHNEFQVMYSSLNININNTVFIHYPLVFYSFKQQIKTASIDYDLKDIFNHPEKEKILNLSKELSKQYLHIINLLKTLYKDNIKASIFLTNSIHRHPTSSNFSSIDTSKDYDNPGVIYRNKKAKNVLQVDSVIYTKDTGYYYIEDEDLDSYYIIRKKESKTNNNEKVLICDNLANIINVEEREVNNDKNIYGIYENIKSIVLLLKEDSQTEIGEKHNEEIEKILGNELNLNISFNSFKDLIKYSLERQNNSNSLTIQDLIEKFHIVTKHTKFKPYLILTYLMKDFYNNEYKNKFIVKLSDFEEYHYEIPKVYPKYPKIQSYPYPWGY